MKYLICLASLWFFINQSLYAQEYTNQCEMLFDNGIATHSPGRIRLDYGSWLPNSGVSLAASDISQSRYGGACSGEQCTATGIPAAGFPDISAKLREAADKKTGTLRLYFADELRWSPRQGQYFHKIKLDSFSTLYLEPGDYWVNRLILKYISNIRIIGKGQVRIFANKVTLSEGAYIGNESHSDRLLIVTDSLSAGAFSQVSGFVYSHRRTRLLPFAGLYGALSAGSARLFYGSEVIYQKRKLKRLDYGWICDLDNDGIYDKFDSDADGDGYSNKEEEQAGSSPFDASDIPKDSDGDGIPDYLDDDIDGDGYSNEEELAKGTDPYDPKDFPQPIPPEVILTTASGSTVSSNQFILTGRIRQGSGDIDRATIENVQTQKSSPLSLNDAGFFSFEMTLSPGLNQYRVVVDASDGVNDQQEWSITYQPPFSVDLIAPADGTTSDHERLTVSIELTAVDENTIVKLAGIPVPLKQEIAGRRYLYQGEVTLQPGENNVSISALSGQNYIDKSLSYRYQPADSAAYPAPVISVIAPEAVSRTSSGSVLFVADVTSNVGRMSADINGEAVNLQALGNNKYSISSSVALDDGVNLLQLNITDALGQSSTQQVEVEQDSNAPQIQLDALIVKPPAVNNISSATAVISGVVADDDISYLRVNGQQVELNKTGEGYHFEYAARFPALQNTTVEIEVADDLGNRRRQDLYYYRDTALSMSWISPTFPASWYHETGTGYPFAIRLHDAAGTEQFSADISGEEISLTKTGDLLTGVFPPSLDKGSYTVTVSASTNNGKQINIEGDIDVISREDIPVEILAVKPEHQSSFAEPDVPLQVNFNRPVDPAKIQITARRTLNGMTYLNLDESGTDFLYAKGHQLQQVNVHREAISGGLSMLNEDSVALLYPDSSLGYGAEISWEVSYDGEEVGRYNFTTRDLPTFIQGGVVDTLGQQRSNVTIELKELGLVTTTNNDGSFSFGYQLPASENIAGGNYTLRINGSDKDSSLGTAEYPITVSGSRRNKLPLIRVPNVDRQIDWKPVISGKSSVYLAGGDFKIHRSGAQINIPSDQKALHVQFIPAEYSVRKIMQGLPVNWLYQIQPFGITTTGAVELEIKLPKRNGTYNYLAMKDGESRYSLLVAYNPDKDLIEPVGVGKIEDYVFTTDKPVTLPSLDYIGFAYPLPAHQTYFKQYLEKTMSFSELVSRVTREISGPGR